MEAKRVIKLILVFLFIICCANNLAFSQASKFLLFDKTKDSLVNIEKIKYYKIDSNLFDINRYNEIDTISSQKMNEIEISSVEKLWKVSKIKHDSIIELSAKNKKIKVIETRNQLFNEIYVLEKISNCNYKRTRVWWKDYQ